MYKKINGKIDIAGIADDIIDFGGYLTVGIIVLSLPFGILLLIIQWFLEK